MTYISVFNNLPDSFYDEIAPLLEKNRALEMELLQVRAAMAVMKEQYLKAFRWELKSRGNWIIIDGKYHRFNRAQVNNVRGSCHLVFNPLLASGNVSKREVSFPWSGIVELDWVERPSDEK